MRSLFSGQCFGIHRRCSSSRWGSFFLVGVLCCHASPLPLISFSHWRVMLSCIATSIHSSILQTLLSDLRALSQIAEGGSSDVVINFESLILRALETHRNLESVCASHNACYLLTASLLAAVAARLPFPATLADVLQHGTCVQHVFGTAEGDLLTSSTIYAQTLFIYGKSPSWFRLVLSAIFLLFEVITNITSLSVCPMGMLRFFFHVFICLFSGGGGPHSRRLTRSSWALGRRRPCALPFGHLPPCSRSKTKF